ncbi:MAG TPA: DNA-binding protein WhiA [Ruminococcaceae bacterium]|nr:DNA-binding protein WhiA [Oscillospiraceae bacterium]
MTFAYQLKNEICNNKSFRAKHKAAQAYGLMRFSKSFDKDKISLHTEHKAVADLYCFFISELIGITGSLTVTKHERRDRKKYFIVTVDDEYDRRQILNYFYSETGSLNKQILMDDSDIAAFLSGVYLACGNITNPEKGYHLEFSVADDELAKQLESLINSRGITAKLTKRRGVNICYIKESEQIEDLLTLIGATNSTLELMEVKIYKDIRNKANRLTNCETANIEKTVSAAAAQIADINLIISARGEEYLSDDLLELAKIRLENPEMSLREIGESLTKPISRSGVNHRLKRIAEIAQDIKEKGV